MNEHLWSASRLVMEGSFREALGMDDAAGESSSPDVAPAGEIAKGW